MEFTIPVGALIDFTARILRVNAINASTGKITERLRKSVCKFQLEYTNYYFSSSRLHKLFKESEQENKPQTWGVQKGNQLI